MIKLALVGILFLTAAAVFLSRRRTPRSRVSGAIWALLIAGAAMGVAAPRGAGDTLPAPDLRPTGGGYVTSTACRSCHPHQHATWHASFHRTMTQPATPETVIPEISDHTFESRGRTCRIWRSGDEFCVRMVNPDWEMALVDDGVDPNTVADPPLRDFPIVMTTGSHHFQTYWIQGRHGNELRQVPFVWQIEAGRWIPREDSFLRPPSDERDFTIWNQNCIQCHALAGQPGRYTNREFGIDALFSRVAELGISCEACHGPGAEHVAAHRNPWTRYRERFSDQRDPTIVNPDRCDPKVATQICGQCHANFYPKDERDWWRHGYTDFKPGDELEQSRYVLSFAAFDENELPEGIRRDPELLRLWTQDTGAAENRFWHDGTPRVGGREYPGLLQSLCYQRGELSCLSCHVMHQPESEDRAEEAWANDQLAVNMASNEACLQCHEKYRDRLAEHTHHQADSAGSQCYNCHMPHTSYALFKAIRSHQIDSPTTSLTAGLGRPNACNLCHLDRTLAWTADWLSDWYGQPRVEADAERGGVAAGVRWALEGDAAQRAIVAWHLGWEPAEQASGTEWMAPFLGQLLVDPYAAIRFMAGRSLAELPEYSELDYDFLAPEDQRDQMRRDVFARWQTCERKLRSSGPVLLDENGAFQHERFKALLDDRDNRPITISE